MEDKILEMCKKVIDGEVPHYSCQEIDCLDCPFKNMKIDCYTNSIEIEEIAQNYIKEHEKTVNTIEKIEEKHKYKVGDKVRVKSDLKVDIPYSRVWANHTMLEEKNEILTIEKIVGNKEYRVEENQWLWGEDMFEPVEETVTLKELQEIKNNVDHPKHYTNGKYECIDIIEDITKGLTGLEAVCTANVIKYMWRWKLKNGAEDLKKARWYLNKLIDNTEIKEIEETYQTEGMAD